MSIFLFLHASRQNVIPTLRDPLSPQDVASTLHAPLPPQDVAFTLHDPLPSQGVVQYKVPIVPLSLQSQLLYSKTSLVTFFRSLI